VRGNALSLDATSRGWEFDLTSALRLRIESIVGAGARLAEVLLCRDDFTGG